MPKSIAAAAVLLLIANQNAVLVAGHGAMQWPPSWFDAAAGGTKAKPCGWGKDCFGAGIMWFTNQTTIPGEPTIRDGSDLLTYPKVGAKIPGGGSLTRKHPWRAPGSAAVFSPCGIEGGNPTGCPPGDESSRGKPCPGGGSGWGPDALNDTALQAAAPTIEWKAGSVVEAGWGIRANHGGGYSFRLCKRDPSQPRDGLTESCFQRTPLAFEGTEQWVQFGSNTSNRVAFLANRTSEGTTPAGSQWTKDPIPACASMGGGSTGATSGADCGSLGTQFPSPAMNLVTNKPLEGFCESAADGYKSASCEYAIVDKLRVPADLEAGDWVLSFRWDCEQTPQVWSTCSNVRITTN